MSRIWRPTANHEPNHPSPAPVASRARKPSRLSQWTAEIEFTTDSVSGTLANGSSEYRLGTFGVGLHALYLYNPPTLVATEPSLDGGGSMAMSSGTPVLTLMVSFTDAAANDPLADTSTKRNNIANAIGSQLQAVFDAGGASSGVDATVTVVDVYVTTDTAFAEAEEAPPPESGTYMREDLEILQERWYDDYLNDIPSRRNDSSVEADIVVLIVDGDPYVARGGEPIGIAFFNTQLKETSDAGDFSEQAYAIVRVENAADAANIFEVHEIGHVLAAGHDLAGDDDSDPTWPDEAHGAKGALDATVMTRLDQCDPDPQVDCDRRRFLSEPGVNFNEIDPGTGLPYPAGSADEDNDSQVDDSIGVAAGFGEIVVTMPPPNDPTALDIEPLACWGKNISHTTPSQDPGPPIDEYNLYRSPNTSYSPQYLVYSGTKLNVRFTVTSTQFMRVEACNSDGCSNYVNGDEPATYTSGCL
jgi:hypothetical protein